ncbi:MAG TPA: thioredoxin family protein [Thermoanaerobaculia bacterium]
MIRRTALLAAAMAFVVAPHVFAGTWHKSIASAQKVAKEKKQLILIDMFAEWCGWCHRFEREVFPSMAFQQATDDIVLLRLNTEDGGEGTSFAKKYSITSLPTFVLVDQNLSMAGLIRGYSPPNEFAKQLADVRAAHTAFEKRVKDEAKIAKDYVQRIQLAKDFMGRSAYDKSEPRLRKLTTEKGVPASIRDEAYYQLAISSAMQGKLDDALKTVRALSAISKVGEYVERSRLLAGQIYMQQGNWLGAANEFRDFKKTFPNSKLNANIDAVLPDLERRLSAGGTGK